MAGEFSPVDRRVVGEDAESLFAAVGGMQRYVPAEVSAPVGEPVNVYPEDQFDIQECPGGYEGRTRPLPSPEASADTHLRKAHRHLIGALEGVIDVEAGLEDILQQGEQQ